MLSARAWRAAAVAAVLLAAACSSAPPPQGSPSSSPSAPSSGATHGGTNGTGPPGTTQPEDLDSNVAAIADDHTLPGRGNPAIDVRHYDLALDWNPTTDTLRGQATLTIRAVDAFGPGGHPTIDLDLQPFTIDGVTVDDRPAESTAGDGKLRITAPVVAAGDRMTVVVRYSGQPEAVQTAALDGVSVGWLHGDGESIVLAEPDGAHSWFPLNDHPLDKATYSFAVTVPTPLVAVANGRLEGTDESGDGSHRTYRWVMDAPMAAYLASVATGNLQETGRQDADAVAYSSWVPADDADVPVDEVPRAVARIADKIGPFPFATYGATIYDDDAIADEDATTKSFISNVALEVQGRSMYARQAFQSGTIVHETAHQWFGDSVSVTDWGDDIWWVEGFATFAETAFASDTPPAQLLDRARSTFQARWTRCKGTAVDGLAAADLFNGPSYECGALVFYALWKEVGDDTFWSILRTFQDEHRHANASTDDLIVTASTVAGRDLGPFLRSWLSANRPTLP